MFPGTLPKTDQPVPLGAITESLMVRLAWREDMIRTWQLMDVPYLQVDQIEENGRTSAIPIVIGVLEYSDHDLVVVLIQKERHFQVRASRPVQLESGVIVDFCLPQTSDMLAWIIQQLKTKLGEPSPITRTAEELTEVLSITPQLVSMTDEQEREDGI